jgi:hypothetical protein
MSVVKRPGGVAVGVKGGVVRGAMVGVAGVFCGCGQESATASGSNTVVGSPGGSLPAPIGLAVRLINVTVRGGQVSGEVGRVIVALGSPVTLSVMSDVAEKADVHGYDRGVEIPAGGRALVSFPANVPGVVGVEWRKSKRPLLQLQVS